MIRVEYDKMYALEDTHWWFLAKREFLHTLLPDKKTNWKILDMGSGTGGLSQFLQRWGSIQCIENSPVGLAYINKRKLNVLNQDINNFIPKKNCYDLVTICDVLYHKNIKDDISVISKAFNALKPGGHLIITDSALPWLMTYHDKIMQARERYYLEPLVMKVKNSGFTIRKKSYVYFLLFSLTCIIKKISTFTHTQNVTSINPYFNWLLLKICKVESQLLKHISFPIGSSVLIFAQKPR